MESQTGLGIYVSKDTATVVYINSRAKEAEAVSCFSVAVPEGGEEEQTNMQILARLIAQGLTEKNWRFSEISVALDCTMFMQHSVHSEFRDPKQIGATVKFDTEESLATDITKVALAFEVASSDETGSEVTVFTAERTILSDLLTALQQYNLDPITIEPDVNCLARFLHREGTPEQSQQGVLFALLSRHCGYLIIPVGLAEGSRKAPLCRTFLVGKSQGRTGLIAREVLITTALAQDTETPQELKIFDSAGMTASQGLREKLDMEVQTIDLSRAGGIRLQELDAGANPIDIAIAYGAALTHSEKGHKVDFRNDFSPFLGKRLKLQKSLKFAAVSVTVLLVAVGLYFQIKLFSVDKTRDGLRAKFARDYSDVALERLRSTVSAREATRKLGGLLRRVEAEKMGLNPSHKSISSNLTLVLKAFNTCAAQTDLNIDSLTVTDELMTVQANVASRQDRQSLFEAVEKGGLSIEQQKYTSSGGRESFNITLKPKKAGGDAS